MNRFPQTQVWHSRIAAAGDFLRLASSSHRVRCLALALCVFSLIRNHADAGVIVPLLSEEVIAQSCAITDTCGSLTGGESERNAEEADDGSIGYDRSASKRRIAAQMAAFPPGCGAPVPGSGESSAGSSSTSMFSNTADSALMRSIGRVATEINLVLPVLAPTEMLDPPRVAV